MEKEVKIKQMNKKEKSVIFASLFEKKQAVEKLVEESVPTSEFYFLIIASTLIITLGLCLNSASIIIGGMLLAPLFSPLLILGLGIVLSNKEIIFNNFKNFLKSVATIILTSLILTFLLNLKKSTPEILLRTNPSLEYFLVAFISGIAGTYFWIKPHLQNLISGIIIAVALIPPLACFGIGINLLNRDIISGSLMSFLINFIGIILGSIIMFSLFGFGKEEKVEETIEKKMEEMEKKKKT